MSSSTAALVITAYVSGRSVRSLASLIDSEVAPLGKKTYKMSDYYYVETLIFLTPFKSTFMDPLAAYKSISRSLEHTTKQKIRKAAPAFVQKARGLTASDTIAAAAAESLKMALPSANPKQLGVLTIYLSGLVVAAASASLARSSHPNSTR